MIWGRVAYLFFGWKNSLSEASPPPSWHTSSFIIAKTGGRGSAVGEPRPALFCSFEGACQDTAWNFFDHTNKMAVSQFAIRWWAKWRRFGPHMVRLNASESALPLDLSFAGAFGYCFSILFANITFIDTSVLFFGYNRLGVHHCSSAHRQLSYSSIQVEPFSAFYTTKKPQTSGRRRRDERRSLWPLFRLDRLPT
jgi:hypothetical protein